MKISENRLKKIRENRACRRLPANASVSERNDAHKIRMRAKAILRARMHKEFSGPVYIRANLGKNHPDYGMSVHGHLAEKNYRNTENNS